MEYKIYEAKVILNMCKINIDLLKYFVFISSDLIYNYVVNNNKKSTHNKIFSEKKYKCNWKCIQMSVMNINATTFEIFWVERRRKKNILQKKI